MERQGRDRSPLGLLERVVEIGKVGELERVRRSFTSFTFLICEMF
jgi:hypothetical protein